MEPTTEKDAFDLANKGYLIPYELGRLTQDELESLNKHPSKVDFYRYMELRELFISGNLHNDSRFQDVKSVFEILGVSASSAVSSGTSGDTLDDDIFFFLTRGYLLRVDIERYPNMHTENPELHPSYRIYQEIGDYVSAYKEYSLFQQDVKDLILLVFGSIKGYLINYTRDSDRQLVLIDRFKTYAYLIPNTTLLYEVYKLWGMAIPDLESDDPNMIIRNGINTFPSPRRMDELYARLYRKLNEYFSRAVSPGPSPEFSTDPKFKNVHTNPDFNIIKLLAFSEEQWYTVYPDVPYDHRLSFVMEKE